MGNVYLARQLSLNRPVALKVLRPDLLAKPTYLKRFEAEAWAVAKLNHPNIVQIHTLGHVDDVRFIALEYVQGTNLRDLILKKGPLDLTLALSIMKQVGVAVGVAGELGLIHRDIKPENILLTRKGQVKVADFGLCRDQDADGIQVTQSGVTMGTPLYMSPEQAQGKAIDHRSDLYSLGVTFYQMIAGIPPFEGQTALAVALKHVKDVPVSLRVRRPEVPADLDRLVLKLMAKNPADRYQSASEMLRDLGRIQVNPNAPAPASTQESTAERVAAAATSVASSIEEAVPVDREGWGGRPGKRAGVALISLCLVIGLALGWLSRPPDLLSDSSPTPQGPPGLWMAPAWKDVQKQKNAEAQYRYAQLRVSSDDPEAAWLAVPGHFPGQRPWTTQAYVQLARLLLRRHDVPGLKALATDIENWDVKITPEKDLAAVIRTALALFEEGDLDGVIKNYNTPGDLSALYDPALVELSIEVMEQARIAAFRTPTTPKVTKDKILDTRNDLVSNLFRIENPAPPGRGRR
jgi:serine/threonine-protein kinase